MPISDQDIITKILSASLEGKIDWKPTARSSEFAASFGGKWTLLADSFQSQTGGLIEDLTMKDSAGKQLIRITSRVDPRVSDLYELARRQALKVDEALEDLFKEIDEPQS